MTVRRARRSPRRCCSRSSAAPARAQSPEPYRDPPFTCTVARLRNGAPPELPAPADDPLCVRYDKTNITGRRSAWSTSLLPNQGALRSSRPSAATGSRTTGSCGPAPTTRRRSSVGGLVLVRRADRGGRGDPAQPAGRRPAHRRRAVRRGVTSPDRRRRRGRAEPRSPTTVAVGVRPSRYPKASAAIHAPHRPIRPRRTTETSRRRRNRSPMAAASARRRRPRPCPRRAPASRCGSGSCCWSWPARCAGSSAWSADRPDGSGVSPKRGRAPMRC